jgi:hypothetical protein
MASTYTANTGIELIANGEQSGTWGDTTNSNLQIIDRLTDGVGSIVLSGTTHTLTTADGTLSDGQYAVLVFGGSPSGTNTVTISPNNATHVYIVKNNSGQSVVLSQGSGGNVTVGNGKSAIVYADGAGAGATVVDVTSTFNLGTVTSVAASAGTGISVSGSPITTSGTLTITNTAPHIATNLTYSTASTTGTVNSSTGTNATLPAATTSLAGLLTGADKTKLDGIATGATANTGTVTSVGGTGTVNGISLSGTITSSGNLTLGGSVSIDNANWSGTDLSVSNGGTGRSSVTSGRLLVGNGTSTLNEIAPGSSGNILTSNGSTWTSSAPAGGGGSKFPKYLKVSPIVTTTTGTNYLASTYGATWAHVFVVGAGTSGNTARGGFSGSWSSFFVDFSETSFNGISLYISPAIDSSGQNTIAVGTSNGSLAALLPQAASASSDTPSANIFSESYSSVSAGVYPQFLNVYGNLGEFDAGIASPVAFFGSAGQRFNMRTTLPGSGGEKDVFSQGSIGAKRGGMIIFWGN